MIPITDDAAAEPAEDLTVNLSSPVNATITDGTGVVVIGASDAAAVGAPALSAPPDVIVGEGDGFVDLPVRLSVPGLSTVTVAYTNANSSAIGSTSCNFDYVGVNGTLSFAPGETTKTIRIDLLDCPDVEGFQSFTLELSSPTNATIARASTRVGIVDNDTLAATPALFVRDTTADEKDGNARVSVLLGGTAGQATGSTVTVTYTTLNGGAIAGSDYTTTTGTLTFAPGETAKTILIPISDDTTTEPTESLTLELTNPTNATITKESGTIRIGASDAAAVGVPALSAPPDLAVGEIDGFVDLAVSLATPGGSTVTVHYATANGTASSGTSCNGDYIGVSGTISFAPGETTKTIRIDLLDCAAVDPTETFSLTLTSPVNATIARPTVQVSIVDNGSPPPPTLTSIAVTPANPSVVAGTNLQFVAIGTFSDSSTADLTATATWNSATTATATITSGGLAHAVAQGTSTIKATVGAINGTTVLTVTPPILLSIAVTPSSPTIAPGTNQQFTATGTFSNGTTANLTGSVTWSSSKAAVATISGSGLAHAVAKGTSTIKATSGAVNGITLLSVK